MRKIVFCFFIGLLSFSIHAQVCIEPVHVIAGKVNPDSVYLIHMDSAYYLHIPGEIKSSTGTMNTTSYSRIGIVDSYSEIEIDFQGTGLRLKVGNTKEETLKFLVALQSFCQSESSETLLIHKNPYITCKSYHFIGYISEYYRIHFPKSKKDIRELHFYIEDSQNYSILGLQLLNQMIKNLSE